MLYFIYVTMFYTAACIHAWLILLFVIHCIVYEVSEIDRFGEILIRIEYSQVINQL